MAKYLNLQIPNACHEQWQNMAPQHDGRYCQSCKKSVIDFTAMSDDELVRHFRHHSGSTCGRFTDEQLNRDFLIPRKPIPWVKYFFRYSLPAFLFMLKGNVQAQIRSPKIEISPIRCKSSLDAGLVPSKYIFGYVMDGNGKPLTGASVFVKGTVKGTATDSTGKYVLHNVAIPATLQVSFVGFETKEVPVDSNIMVNKIELQISPVKMSEILITGYAMQTCSVRMGAVVTARRQRKEAIKIWKEMSKQTVSVNNKTSFMVYPNPVISGSTINLQGNNLEQGTYLAALYSTAGQMLQSSNINYPSRNNHMTLKLIHVPAGVYTLTLIHQKTRKHFNQQILIQD